MRVLVGLLSAVLATYVQAIIRVKNQYNVTVYNEDLLQYNISDLFDLSQASNYTCQTTFAPAHIYNKDSVLQTKNLTQYGFGDEPEIAEFVTNTTFYAVYDNKNIVIQDVNLDGESFGDMLVYNFGTPGIDAVCTDLTVNAILNRIYVACMTSLNATVQNFNIYVLELDGNTGQLINMLTVPQQPSNLVQHRLQIKIANMWPLDPRGQVTPYAYVYDQGVSSGLSQGNQWLLVLKGVQTGDLFSAGYATFNTTQLNLKSLYDIFPYENQLLVMGKIRSGDNTINLGYCGFGIYSNGSLTINCTAYVVQSLLNTTFGYIGVMNTGQYVEINNDPQVPSNRQMIICSMIDSFYSANFIDQKNCRHVVSYQLPNNVFISNVEGNVHMVVVKYAHYDSTYAGYSLHSFDLRYEYQDIDDSLAPHVIPMAKTLIRLDRVSMNLTRQVQPYLFVKASDLNPDSVTMIRVDCTDGSGTATNIVNVTALSNMKKNVYSNGDSVPNFNVYPGSHVIFQVNPHEVMGNDLQFTVGFDPSVANYTTSIVYDTEPVKIGWILNKSTGVFSNIYFNGNYAIAKDSNYLIIIFECRFEDINAIECIETAATVQPSRNAQLQEDIVEIFDYLFAWSTDPFLNTTTVYIYDGESQVYTHTFPGIPSDAMMTQQGSTAYLAMAYPNQNVIRNFRLYDNRPSVLDESDPITVELSSRQFFCPVNVSFAPNDATILEVLSFCPNEDQRILRYRYPPQVVNMRTVLPLISTVPINFAYQNISYCSMGSEYVIWSYLNGNPNPNLQSVALVDDRNGWMFGTGLGNDDFDLGTLQSFSCVSRAGIFSVVSAGLQGNKILSVWWGNNQYQANHRLYKTQRTGLNGYKSIRSYELRGQVIHVLNSGPGVYDFWLTWSTGPVIDVQFLYGIPATTITMYLKFLNSMSGSLQIAKAVAISTPDTSLSTSITQRLVGTQTDIVINLEDYVSIKGSVLEMNVQGSGGLHLIPRISRVGEYVARAQDANTFTHFESQWETNIGVHTTKYNSSVFSFFNYNTHFEGTFQSPHGVRDFHFALFPNDNTTVLLAYSTAEPEDNSLQFLVMNGSVAIASNNTPSSETHDYTDIKVVRLESNNSNVIAFLVIGHNWNLAVIEKFIVTYSNGLLQYQWIDRYTDAQSFSFACVNNSDNCVIVYSLKSVETHLNFDLFSKWYNSSSSALVIDKRLYAGKQLKNVRQMFGNLKDFSEAYAITFLHCGPHNSTHFYCLINSRSTVIQEFIFDGVTYQNLPQSFSYPKMPNFDGVVLDSDGEYFVYLGESRRPTYEARYLAYKRQSRGGDGYIWYSQHTDTPRPFTVSRGPQHSTRFQFCSAFPTIPVFFLKIDKALLNITDRVNLTTAEIMIDGIPGSSHKAIAVSSLMGAATNSGKWWPFLLILGVLILCAIGYIVYINTKKRSDHGEEVSSGVKTEGDKYASLKTEDVKAPAKEEKAAN